MLPVEFGVTHWPRDLGPYMWHEFDTARVRADVRAIAATGMRRLRTLLPWDVFMPAIARPPASAMRNLESLLSMAEAEGVGVVPVLFAQSIGDCLMLPAYAIDVSAPRRGVRALTGGVVQPGGPRDQYTDPRMLEAELLWLETLLDAFAGHPAIAAWDFGHDPANTLRPRRTEHMRRWCADLAARVHERDQRCELTLGAPDVHTARGVRLAAVAESVDAVGVLIDPAALFYADGAADVHAVVFLVQLAMRLAGAGRLHAHVMSPLATVVGDDGMQRFARDCVSGLSEIGCAAVSTLPWSQAGPRIREMAPFDREPLLGDRGIVGTDDEATAFGAAWIDSVATEQPQQEAEPWPDTLDVADYYANLPHSIQDLFDAWQRATARGPGKLD